MDKIKFIGVMIVGLVVYYMFLSILMPLIVSTSGGASSNVTASANAATYVGAAAAANYTPLVLYIVPSVLALAAIAFKLKQSGTS